MTSVWERVLRDSLTVQWDKPLRTLLRDFTFLDLPSQIQEATDFLPPPATCDFSHAILGEGHFQGKASKKASFPLSVGKNRMSQRVENRGSLISVPWPSGHHPSKKHYILETLMSVSDSFHFSEPGLQGEVRGARRGRGVGFSFTMRAEMIAYMIYSEGPEYHEYVMQF